MSKPNWQAWDTAHVWHPYTQMKLIPEAIPVESASGSYLHLADGRKVFDSISSWWVTLHGHAQPHIAKRIAEQAAKMEQVIFANFTHQPAAELAKRLVERTPKTLQKVFYSDNGSTAVEVAMKMCVQYWKHMGEERTVFLAIEAAYHGDTFGAMAVSARSSFTAPFDAMLSNVIHLPFPKPPEDESIKYSQEEEQFLEALKKVLTSDNTIAGFIFEPLLLGSGGMKMWRPKILKEAVEMVQRHHVFAIADEVLTGFGRTGTMFASEQAGITPDIMTLSKGITGGFLPLGVTLATETIFNIFLSEDRSKTFFHGHSYTANPISCAASLASLEVFEREPVFDRIKTINQVHHERMPMLAEKHESHVRILGTIAAMEPKATKGYLNTRSIELSKRALEYNLFLRPLGDIVYFLPPYSTNAQDLHKAYDILEEIL